MGQSGTPEVGISLLSQQLGWVFYDGPCLLMTLTLRKGELLVQPFCEMMHSMFSKYPSATRGFPAVSQKLPS